MGHKNKPNAHEIITRSGNVNALSGRFITIDISGTKRSTSEEPQIHWDRIPSGVASFRIDKVKGIVACCGDADSESPYDWIPVFGWFRDNAWAFPNWYKFTGQTFTREYSKVV